jgi:hypothetical protein
VPRIRQSPFLQQAGDRKISSLGREPKRGQQFFAVKVGEPMKEPVVDEFVKGCHRHIVCETYQKSNVFVYVLANFVNHLYRASIE